ncbi:MAG: M48 family metallopeptidase, partial [Deltaproteobacteria bacterium]|nr:M48 family metallopeptidase [Deltaproteobacteria bacterium]
AELKRRGFIYQDPVISSYVRDLGNKLSPDIRNSHIDLEFFVLRDPTPNAMALPNGNIYLNIGLISLFENEAQLASVMAHEISHVIHRHGIRSKMKGNSSVLAANITDIFLLGTKLSYVTASMGLANYSRDQEEEADREALTLLAKAGYDLSQAPRTLELLSEVYPADSSFGPYRSHPDEEKRIVLIQETIQTDFSDLDSADRIRKGEFGSLRPRVVEDSIQLRIAFRQYQLALKDLDRAEAYYEQGPLLNYYRGEVYRGIGDHPFDAAVDRAWMETGKKPKKERVAEFEGASNKNYGIALGFYQEALAENPELLMAYRGIGYIAYAQGREDSAISSFETYLTIEERLDDRLYIERLLRELTEEST